MRRSSPCPHLHLHLRPHNGPHARLVSTTPIVQCWANVLLDVAYAPVVGKVPRARRLTCCQPRRSERLDGRRTFRRGVRTWSRTTACTTCLQRSCGMTGECSATCCCTCSLRRVDKRLIRCAVAFRAGRTTVTLCTRPARTLRALLSIGTRLSGPSLAIHMPSSYRMHH
jgi:hypothetical protein